MDYDHSARGWCSSRSDGGARVAETLEAGDGSGGSSVGGEAGETKEDHQDGSKLPSFHPTGLPHCSCASPDTNASLCPGYTPSTVRYGLHNSFPQDIVPILKQPAREGRGLLFGGVTNPKIGKSRIRIRNPFPRSFREGCFKTVSKVPRIEGWRSNQGLASYRGYAASEASGQRTTKMDSRYATTLYSFVHMSLFPGSERLRHFVYR